MAFEKYNWLFEKHTCFQRCVDLLCGASIYFAGCAINLFAMEIFCRLCIRCARFLCSVYIFCRMWIYCAGYRKYVQDVRILCAHFMNGGLFFAECIFILQKDSTSCKIIRHPAKKSPPLRTCAGCSHFMKKKVSLVCSLWLVFCRGVRFWFMSRSKCNVQGVYGCFHDVGLFCWVLINFARGRFFLQGMYLFETLLSY